MQSQSKNSSNPARKYPRSIEIDGKLWDGHFIAENVRSAKAMKARHDDIFVCTYAKSGTTWILHIVHQLLGDNLYDSCNDENKIGNQSNKVDAQVQKKGMYEVSPMLEKVGAAYMDALESPRVFKSHFTYDEIPKGGGAKYIYACRNPKDCLTSYFHHHRNVKTYDFENGDFDVFFELFMAGRVAGGDYFDHLTSWLDGITKKDEDVLLIKYEDMIADIRSAVVKIAKFLGGKAAENIRNEQQLTKIVEASTLASMKRNQHRWIAAEWTRGDFIRKGGSRDWKNLFSQEQSEEMDSRFHHHCSGSAAANWWKTEMQWE